MFTFQNTYLMNVVNNFMNFNNLGVYSVIFLNICIPVAQESHFNAGCKVRIPINGMHNKIDI